MEKPSNIRNDGSAAEQLNGSTVLSKAVGILYDLIERDKRIEPGRASLIRTAVDFGFRSSVYSDVIERMKTLEKNQAAGSKQ